jgi:hypothetical protein
LRSRVVVADGTIEGEDPWHPDVHDPEPEAEQTGERRPQC